MADLVLEWLDYLINGIDFGTKQDQRRVWSWLHMKAELVRAKRTHNRK